MRPLGLGLEEGDRKLVTAWSQLLASSDFKALWLGDGRGQKRIQRALSGALFEAIREQQDGGFLILRLPGLQEVIRRGERADVVEIHRRRGLGLGRRRDRERDQQQRGNESPDQEKNFQRTR